jgi:hypothetical protein
VVLNTPGIQDGVFRLEVDGRVALDLSDVFYRDVQKSSPTPQDPDSGPAAPAVPSPTALPDVGDGLLGPLLGDLLGGLILDDDGSQVRASAAQKGSSGVIDSAGPLDVATNPPAVKKSVERRADRHADGVPDVTREDSEPIGFRGFFFRCVLLGFTTQSGQADPTTRRSAPSLEDTTRSGPRRRTSLFGSRILNLVSMIWNSIYLSESSSFCYHLSAPVSIKWWTTSETRN